jgi:hypothetical protein
MYLSANAGRGFHIWRQRFPDGLPQQVTFGATEEEGVQFAPGGRSFVTSVGTTQSTMWIHDQRSDRQITTQGYPGLPSFSGDGQKLYYLSFLASTPVSRALLSGNLWVADLQSDNREKLLPDFRIEHYAVAPDGNRVVFVNAEEGGHSLVWRAMLDGSSSPRRLTSLKSVTCYFDANWEVFFVGGEGSTKFLYRIGEDGSGLQKVVSEMRNPAFQCKNIRLRNRRIGA